MQTKVQKWGNSLAVRLPKPFAQEVHLACGAPVDLSVMDGKIIIDPQVAPEYRLEDLLEGVTDENRHAEVDTGEAVGKEVW